MRVYLEGPVPGSFPTTPSFIYSGTLNAMTQTSSNNFYNDVTFVDNQVPKRQITKYTRVKLEILANLVSPSYSGWTVVNTTTVNSIAP
jgi:hypothetical protein